MKTKNEGTIELFKEFPVPVEELYRAWISPEALKQWWRPMDKKLTEVKNEVKKGGSIKYVASDAEAPIVITGEYEEVKEHEKLIYSWNFDIANGAFEESSYRLTVEFSGNGDNSRLSVKQEDLKDHEAVMVHKKGWERQLENLEKYLNDQSS